MATEKYLKYRGSITAAVGFERTVAFVTQHDEGQATALYRLNAESFALATDALPCGGLDVAVDGARIYVAGTDGQVYAGARDKGALSAFGPRHEAGIAALAPVADGALAVVTGAALVFLASDGTSRQTLALAEEGAALAADPTGRWLAVGTRAGTVAVFECEGEGRTEWAAGGSAKLHEGPVTALLFEREELRFYSTGHDQQLLSTHARGTLEPEDRGKGGTHDDRPTALVMGDAERFYSSSIDASIKAWPLGKGGRPATTKDELARVGDLAKVTIEGRPHLVAACLDNTLRFFLLDAAGKIGQRVAITYDAAAMVSNELAQSDVKRREAALREAASWNDARGIDLVAQVASDDGDHALRREATERLGSSGNSRAIAKLDSLLHNSDEPVRLAALRGLRALQGEDNLEPLNKALRVGRKDIGVEAVRALVPLARKDELAFERLVQALNDNPIEARQAALEGLEAVSRPDTPDGTLMGLRSSHADVRRLALIRLHQRKILGNRTVQAALRKAAEDGDGLVRRTAFLVLVLSRPALADALRARDKDLHRSLYELEHHGEELKDAELPKVKAKKVQLSEDELRPLLDAMASANLDTCVAGVSGLASLGDPRAFGILLQLSREQNESARVYVCRALAQLGDVRSVDRLGTMLRDGATSVRDAAFSALSQLYEGEPLKAAEAGLDAEHEDVRRRGLQVLAKELKAKPPKSEAEPGVGLLVRALNNGFAGVRTEAFKTALNLQVGGGGVDTLRFIRRSVHSDVRREVLTEVMAQVNEAWAWALLLEFFNDPDAKLRAEAFDFAVSKSKGREMEPLEAGLKASGVDIRRKATAALVSKHTKASRALLETVLEDDDKEVRKAAIDALVVADATDALKRAMKSGRADVRAKAAAARAIWGDGDAMGVLAAVIAEEEPQEKEAKAEWAERVGIALDGLAALEDRAAVPAVSALVRHKDTALRRRAAEALSWCAGAEDQALLQEVARDSDKAVRLNGAFGLSLVGDPLAGTLLFSSDGASVLGHTRLASAALALGRPGEAHLVASLDHNEAPVRRKALLVLMALEHSENDGVPDRCLAGLASSDHRVRLMSAQGLEAFPTADGFGAFLVELFNDREDGKPWTIKPAVVEALSEVFAHGTRRLKARAVALLELLERDKQGAFDDAFERFQGRHKAEIAALVKAAGARREAKGRYTEEQIRQIVFGAYVGLARNQDRSSSSWSGSGPVNPVRVRQTALRRLAQLAAIEGYAQPATVTFVQALRDAVGEARVQAFDHLKALGMSAEELGSEALVAGYTDVGIKGLELLSGASSGGSDVLDTVMMNNTDGLEIEAAKLLKDRIGLPEVAKRALEASSQSMRATVVGWLVEAGPESVETRAMLREACASRFRHVRNLAALRLAYWKDGAAFEPLIAKLKLDTYYEQYETINALVALNDPRVPGALLSRVEDDPAGTANSWMLFNSLGQAREPALVPRLLKLLDGPRFRWETINATITISGFDQWNQDTEDENPDKTWETKQHPRRPAVLAQLMLKLYEVGEHGWWSTLMAHARWSRGNEVDGVLATLSAGAREDARRMAVEALGWRLRKRGASAEPLIKALGHGDPETQFLAAEGLARAGRSEGLNVLMTAVEMFPDFSQRVRAVQALGELADARALDLLLGLATNAEHALQETAAEAIGHMGRSDRARDIFKALERLARGDDGIAEAALRGLRHFNTREGWQIVRARAAEPHLWFRSSLLEILGYNDDPATQALLIDVLTTTDDWDEANGAYEALRRIFGAESLEPDYAALRGEFPTINDDTPERVAERGAPDRIFDLLPKVSDEEVRASLQAAVINRSPAPVAEAIGALKSRHPVVAETAARVLGRDAAAAAGQSAALAELVGALRTSWGDLYARQQRGAHVSDELEATTSSLRWVTWALGRSGAGAAPLLELASAHADKSAWRPVRVEAVYTLAAQGSAGAEVQALFRGLAAGADAELRSVAASVLGADRAAAEAIIGELLGDLSGLGRLLGRGAEPGRALREAAGVVHYQGVVLPCLVAAGELEALTALARDAALNEGARLGAVEALGLLGQEPAEDTLAAIGKDEANDTELRKAAWRAFRRSRRLRKKTAQVAEARS